MIASLPISILRDKSLSEKDKVVAMEIVYMCGFWNFRQIKQAIYLHHGIEPALTERIALSLSERGHVSIQGNKISLPTKQATSQATKRVASDKEVGRFVDEWYKTYGVRPRESLSLRSAIGERLRSFSMEELLESLKRRRTEMLNYPNPPNIDSVVNNWNKFIYSDSVVRKFLEAPDIEKQSMKRYKFE